ncbi:MAG: BREX system ATP-binding protein BrxD [Anaerolineales bacterium]|nr:BREX system ATP-binding protein BrxD [Anaerolineales bacterium]
MTVELWLGNEFEHAHEMRALRAISQQLVEHFADEKELYLLLANFYCEGEEIDLAVVKKRAVIVLELKECDAPVIGGPNGDWRIADSGTLNVGRRNPFQQVRQYRYALINYLTRNRYDFINKQKAHQVSFEHVSGLVVFSPTMSPGTNIEISSRDQKWFGVVGLDNLWAELKDRRSVEMNISQGDARKLAAQVLHLKRLDLDEYLGQETPPVVDAEAAPAVIEPISVPPTKPEPAPQPQAGVRPNADRLTEPVARDIVNALRRGTVPQSGLEFLAVGLEREMRTISAQLKHVASGRGDFKFVRGAYGAGKTFLSALTLEEALQQGFAVSYVVVSTDTPLYKLEAVYHRIISNLRTRGQQEGALKGLIDRWLYQVEDKVIELEGYDENDPRLVERVETQIESGLAEMSQHHSAFSAVVRGYYRAQLDNDYPTAQALLGWLSGEQQINYQVKRKVNIKGEIDNTVALEFLRAINLVARRAGMAGMAIVFDEVETVQRLRRPQREQSLNTLRQLVDAIDYGEFPFIYLMFTGTPGFFEDRQGVPALQPLHDRIKLERPDDPFPNPELPQIVLPRFNNAKLKAVANQVLPIYEAVYGPVDRERISEIFIEFMIAEVTSKFGGRVDVVPRQFLRDFVNELDKVRQYPNYVPDAEYEFDRAELGDELTAAEQEAIEPITF